MMNKRTNSSSGGGQSSLGYLFGSDELAQQQNDRSKLASPPIFTPPYDTEGDAEMINKSPESNALSTPVNPPPTKIKDDNYASSSNKYIYHGDKSKDILVTGRPSTRVRSVPGGDSSLGYLFGDK